MSDIKSPETFINADHAEMVAMSSDGYVELTEVAAEPLAYSLGDLRWFSTAEQNVSDVLPGVTSRGKYIIGDDEYPVVAFMYHKKKADGTYETAERLIVLQGIGGGVHPDHRGQSDSYYLIGAQIGVISPDKTVKLEVGEGQVLSPKNFSVDCIDAGQGKALVSAN